MNDLQKHGISQESPFDTRYFTVTIAPDGTVESVDTGKNCFHLSRDSGGIRRRSCGKKERKKALSLIINTLQQTVTAQQCMYF